MVGRRSGPIQKPAARSRKSASTALRSRSDTRPCARASWSDSSSPLDPRPGPHPSAPPPPSRDRSRDQSPIVRDPLAISRLSVRDNKSARPCSRRCRCSTRSPAPRHRRYTRACSRRRSRESRPRSCRPAARNARSEYVRSASASRSAQASGPVLRRPEIAGRVISIVSSSRSGSLLAVCRFVSRGQAIIHLPNEKRKTAVAHKILRANHPNRSK